MTIGSLHSIPMMVVETIPYNPIKPRPVVQEPQSAKKYKNKIISLQLEVLCTQVRTFTGTGAGVGGGKVERGKTDIKLDSAS